MRVAIERAGLLGSVRIDSAGTDAYHAGELPDPRSREAAERRGVRLTHRARQVEPVDFERFDYLLAMDRHNLDVLTARAPASSKATLALFRSFDPSAHEHAEVPDPYYGGARGFEDVLDMTERAAAGLLEHLQRVHRLP